MTGNLRRKLEVLRAKPVVIGGTFFEVVYARDRLDDYKRWLSSLGIHHVEISDGTVDIPRHRKTMQQIYIGACLVAGVFTLLPQRYLGKLLWTQLGLL